MVQHFIGGVNASGKSALAREIGRARPDFEVIHTGTAIMERLGIAPGDVDTLRALPNELKYRENEIMLSALTRHLSGRPVLYDSHYLNMIEGDITPLIHGTWPARLGSLVLIEARPEVLYERIRNDAHVKERRLFPPNTAPSRALAILDNYAQQTRDEFERLARDFELPTLVLHNNSSQLDRAVRGFLDFDNYLNRGIHDGV